MDHAPGEGTLVEGTLTAVSRELDEVVTPTPSLGRHVSWGRPGESALHGYGTAVHLEASGSDRFAEIRRHAETAFDAMIYDGPYEARPRAFGGAAFHESYVPSEDWSGFASAAFVIPSVLVGETEGAIWVTVVDEDPTESQVDRVIDRLTTPYDPSTLPAIRSKTYQMDRQAWTDGVSTALASIDRGPLEKVVLAQALSVTLDGGLPVAHLLDRLSERYPNCYRFLQPGDPGAFFGAPPEQLVRKRDDHIETEALAGSIRRGETDQEDDALAQQMTASEKVRREHDLVVEAIADQLTPFVRSLDIGDRDVHRLATIQHVRTPISGTLEAGRHVLDIVDALHPTPAVGGVPIEAAWETIQQTETFDRGWYAAPVGWFDGAGDGEFTVGIRSGLVRENALTLFAGNGIVAESDPDEEWDEIALKVRPILDELE